MMADLILPKLPENLQNLRKEEDEVRAQSLLHINGNASFVDHLALVHDCLDAIHVHTISHKNVDEEELVLQRLGIRLFNSASCALSLLLSGYYQNAALTIRDLLETGFLVDYLRTDRSQVKVWRDSPDDERRKNFQPWQIRDALDKRDGFTEKKRAEAYKLLSNYASHPTHAGFKLFSPSWMSKIGPFFEETYLKALLEELTKRLAAAADVYVRCFPSVKPNVQAAREHFLSRLAAWSRTYLPRSQ